MRVLQPEIVQSQPVHNLVVVVTGRLLFGVAERIRVRSFKVDHSPALLFKERQNIPLNVLESSFMNFSGAQAYIAYAESLAAVSYINDSSGMSDIQRILERLSQGSSTEAALRATIHSDYGQLESDLARYLADRYGE